MADLDWIFGAILALSTLLGVLRGLVKEVLSLLSWVAAFVLSQRLAPEVANWAGQAKRCDTPPVSSSPLSVRCWSVVC